MPSPVEGTALGICSVVVPGVVEVEATGLGTSGVGLAGGCISAAGTGGGVLSSEGAVPHPYSSQGESRHSSSAGSGTAIELLSRPAGAAMMVAYIVALALIGRFTTFKRDIS